MVDGSAPIRMFVSYAPEDTPLWQELERHLAPLRGEGLVSDWHEGRVLAGQMRAAEVNRHLEEADLVVLLLSADFLASPRCAEITRMALARQATKQAQIIPVVLRPCDFGGTPLGTLQPLPEHGRPVVSWGLRDEAWLSVVRGLRRICGIEAGETAAATTSKPDRPAEAPRWDFFIAHARADSAPAVELYDLLRDAGLRPFVDKRSLLLGADWQLEIPRAQRQAQVTVVLVSTRCDQAYYQQEEIAVAVALARDTRYRHRVVPVYLEGWPADPADFVYGLWGKQGLSAPEAGGLRGVAEELLRLHAALRDPAGQQ